MQIVDTLSGRPKNWRNCLDSDSTLSLCNISRSNRHDDTRTCNQFSHSGSLLVVTPSLIVTSSLSSQVSIELRHANFCNGRSVPWLCLSDKIMTHREWASSGATTLFDMESDKENIWRRHWSYCISRTCRITNQEGESSKYEWLGDLGRWQTTCTRTFLRKYMLQLQVHFVVWNVLALPPQYPRQHDTCMVLLGDNSACGNLREGTQRT
jgi:hypothetical protein